jgi:outer membrane receptor protein involved in Fe transport
MVLDYDVTSRWNIGGNVVASSGSYLHGNENNANQAGGTNGAGEYISGGGWIPGYALVNLQTTYRLSKHAHLFARLNNLFDKQYATAGFLTTNSFNANGTFIADPDNWTHENAVAPAAPRAIWAGVRVQWQ